MSLPKGTVDVEILADGTVRVETGDMGGVAHKTADEMLKMLAQLMGGAVDESKVKHGHTHHHSHDHEHLKGGH